MQYHRGAAAPAGSRGRVLRVCEKPRCGEDNGRRHAGAVLGQVGAPALRAAAREVSDGPDTANAPDIYIKQIRFIANFDFQPLA